VRGKSGDWCRVLFRYRPDTHSSGPVIDSVCDFQDLLFVAGTEFDPEFHPPPAHLWMLVHSELSQSRVKSCNCESVEVSTECDSESELGLAQLSFVFGQLRRMD
jgi:hypothetical protein